MTYVHDDGTERGTPPTEGQLPDGRTVSGITPTNLEMLAASTRNWVLSLVLVLLRRDSPIKGRLIRPLSRQGFRGSVARVESCL